MINIKNKMSLKVKPYPYLNSIIKYNNLIEQSWKIEPKIISLKYGDINKIKIKTGF